MARLASTKLDDREWRRLIKQIKARGTKGWKLLKAVYSIIGFKDVIQHFKDEKNPKGKQWKRWLNRKTGKHDLNVRPSRRGGTKMLQDTGLLRKSIMSKWMKARSRNSIKVFSPLGYSGRHDEGIGKMPKREFMYLSSDAQDKMVGMIAKIISGEVKIHGI